MNQPHCSQTAYFMACVGHCVGSHYPGNNHRSLGTQPEKESKTKRRCHDNYNDHHYFDVEQANEETAEC